MRECALAQREGGYEELTLTVLLVDDANDWQVCAPVEAFTFVGERACPDNCGPPSEYLDLVVEGAESRRLPEAYVRQMSEQR